MAWRSDDLAQVLVGEDREFVGFAQGVLREWDPETYRNAVEVRGAVLTDLPVASGVEALTYQPGDVLMLTRWKPRSGRGIAQYWIGMGGRVIFPGTGAAEQSIAFMRSSLVSSLVDDLVAQLLTSPAGEDLAAFVIGQRVHSESIATPGTRNNTGYGNLTGGGTGPTITGVSISAAGRAVVVCTARVSVNDSAGRSGFMAVEVSGATSRAPDDGAAKGDEIGGTTGGQVTNNRLSSLHLFEDLNPGEHTFTARYRTLTTDGNVTWVNRNVTVIGF